MGNCHVVLMGVLAALIVLMLPGMQTVEAQVNTPKEKSFRIERSMSEQAVACIECHKRETPGIFADWAMSRHAFANITCIDCHRAEPFEPDVSAAHFKQYERSDSIYGKSRYRTAVTAVVSPRDCSRCHPDEALQFSRSKHANTLKIIWEIDIWLNQGLNSEIERTTGCYACHGSFVEFADGKPIGDSWPNVGIGRHNPDGSKGSCSSCHTRHRFSVMEARKPEACGQCHLGPDHPQMEIYAESKHGDIYKAFGGSYNWESAPGTWTPGVDYRAPTCASCHMSGAGSVMTSHNASERLSWELQAPVTVRPSEFKPFPSDTSWELERNKMKQVCLQCHGEPWVDGHYSRLDAAVHEYNQVYFAPAKKLLDDLYEKGVLDSTRFFDDPLEFEYYELWHHEGRRARMGTAMMGPDYAWWHGFYELKKRLIEFTESANRLVREGRKAPTTSSFPGATGSTRKPSQLTNTEP